MLEIPETIWETEPVELTLGSIATYAVDSLAFIRRGYETQERTKVYRKMASTVRRLAYGFYREKRATLLGTLDGSQLEDYCAWISGYDGGEGELLNRQFYTPGAELSKSLKAQRQLFPQAEKHFGANSPILTMLNARASYHLEARSRNAGIVEVLKLTPSWVNGGAS